MTLRILTEFTYLLHGGSILVQWMEVSEKSNCETHTQFCDDFRVSRQKVR
jgi:hypothetical protein